MAPEIIDGHRHLLCPEAQRMALRLDPVKASDYLEGANESSAAINRERAPAWNKKMTDMEEHIADLRAARIDRGVVWPPPVGFYYWAEPSAGAELARLINENTAKAVSRRSDRLSGLCSVPLQDGKKAAEELNHGVRSLGLKGAAVASNVNGNGLDEEAFLPFFAEAERLDAPVFIHPHKAAGANRMRSYYLINFLGYPVDSALAAAQLIFGGVLDRFPRLKICLVHAGGVLPFLLGRFEHGRSVRPEARERCAHPVSHYLKNFYVDTITFRPDTLRFVLEAMGAEHVFLGSDYPFDMGDPDPVRSVEDAVADAAVREKILGQNLKGFMNL